MYYIRQLNESDCGFACIKMILANVFKDKRFLYLKQDLKKQKYSYFELIEIAKKYNLFLTGLKFNNARQLYYYRNKMFLATIKIDNLNHLVLVRKYKHFLKIVDPNFKTFIVSYKKFFKIWDKTILSILNVKENILTNNDIILKMPPSSFFIVFSIIFKVLTIISSFLGLFFVSFSNFLYVAIILFSLTILLEIFYRILNIKILKNIDSVLSKKFEIKDGYEQKFFLDFQTYKKHCLNLYPNLFFNIMMCIIIAFIFILNDSINLYGLILAILIAFINVGIINPYYLKKERNLSLKEKRFLNEKYTLNELTIVSDSSYKIANSFLLVEILFSLLLISIVFLTSYLKNNFDISYIIFYSFSLTFFKKQFESILNFYNFKSRYNQIRLTIANMIKEK